MKKMCKNIILSMCLLTSISFSKTYVYAQDNQGENDENSLTVEENLQDLQNQASIPYRNVIYYGDWSIWGGQNNYYPKDIPANLYTHFNYAFIAFDENGDLYFTDKDAAFISNVGSNNVWGDELCGCIPAINALRVKNPNMKIGFSVGGWSKSKNFSSVANNPEKRKNLINNLIKLLIYTDMDFIDIDWEYPTFVRQPDNVDNVNDEGTPNATTKDKENFNILMTELRTRLNALSKEKNKYFSLSAALPGSVTQLEKCIDINTIMNIIDFANIMTYDLTGAFDDKSGHHTPLYSNPKNTNQNSIKKTMDYLKSKNVDMKKIQVGVAMYSRGWNTVDKGNDAKYPGLFQPAYLTNKDADQTPSRGANNELPLKLGDGGRAGGVYSYRSLDNLKKLIPDLKEYWDDISKAPYMYSEKTKNFYTYDNIESVKNKVNFVKENNLGGIISWMASQDKPIDGNSRKELSQTIKTGFYGNNPIPSDKLSNNIKLNVDVKAAIATLDSGKKGFSFTINNKEILTEKGDLLLANKYYSTVKKATFIIKMKDNQVFTGGDYKAGKVTSSENKTYVDLSPVYDAKFIKPGNSYEFKLIPSNSMKLDVANLEEVVLEQYYDKGIKLSSQIIYSAKNKENINLDDNTTDINDNITEINDNTIENIEE